jgi:RNA polymerase-binding transcription factor DksA
MFRQTHSSAKRAGRVVAFTGGKRCKECGDQIEPVRVRVVPNSSLCVACAREREHQIQLGLRADHPGRVTVIR